MISYNFVAILLYVDRSLSKVAIYDVDPECGLECGDWAWPSWPVHVGSISISESNQIQVTILALPYNT